MVGENGAGKTTLLQLIAGQYMVDKDTVRILGRPAFHDTVSSENPPLPTRSGEGGVTD